MAKKKQSKEIIITNFKTECQAQTHLISLSNLLSFFSPSYQCFFFFLIQFFSSTSYKIGLLYFTMFSIGIALH